MLSILAALAAQSAGMVTSANSPPPVIVALEPSYQSGITIGQPARAAQPDAPMPYPVDVTITAEGRTLYKGTLRLARAFSASYNETV